MRAVKRQDFLLEIRTEEIPAPVLGAAREDLKTRVTEELAEQGLVPESAESLATPRRLIVILRGLPDKQEDKLSEVLGPPASVAFDAEGKLTRAGEGFARAQKVDPSELVVVETPRGKTAAARRSVAGRTAAEVLAEAVPRAVSTLTFPKTMRWGSGERVFVRPIRGLLAILGGQVAPMEVLGVPSSAFTSGHRVLSDGEFAVSGVEDYLGKLRSHGVEPDGEARRVLILDAARQLAREAGGSIESDADLAATLADLVECPGVVRGSFAEEFLELPEEITTTAMRTHQKYLPVRSTSGLLPHFVAVMDNREDPKGFIARGNEWVLNARLADARFFYDDDVRQSLESRLPELARLSFHERLGDYAGKTERLEKLSESIARAVGRADLAPAVRAAARLAKTDLTTKMVREFTDLQGVVGGIYARREGYPDPVWKAIYDQYRPASASDDPPREAPGAILSLADRLDTLAGFFQIGLVPTGSKDPYGLRRAAYGAVAIIAESAWRLDWRPVVAGALALHPQGVATQASEETLVELQAFFAERLRNFLERRGHSYDEISAVLSVDVWNFADVADRAAALSEARKGTDFRSLILASKRIRNIVGDERPGPPSPELYREDAERQLAGDFLQARPVIGRLASSRRYREGLEMIASIAPSLDRFFVEVLVNCPEEELRRNRLALLASIQEEFSRLADFSEIVVEKDR
ncbi:MAG TPA: glycine--tRNA ligase subunit beta [Thermoanaerobaculia bacterium]|nr:glycine--tRNA ligase subunit beta [Thermoanaerobaculia bacterium]